MDKRLGNLRQDAGLTIIIVALFIATLSILLIPDTETIETVVLLTSNFLLMMVAAFRLQNLSIILMAFEILTYTSYLLFLSFAQGQTIYLWDYLWIFLPVMVVGGMILFVSGLDRIEKENILLRSQVNAYVMVDSLTGLYNLKSLYNDMSRQVAYANRNTLELSLMIIELRYEQELRRVLSRQSYDRVIQKLAIVIVDSVRLEDRTYAIDEKGSVGVLLTCNKDESVFVERRIKSKVMEEAAFSGIDGLPIRVEIRVACLEYDMSTYGQDFVRFKKKVESELQYDV